MNFLAPLWLGLAAAIAVPVVLHLLRRRIALRVEFPAARYVARAEQEHSRSLRLRNLLLMLLRAVVLLALALAAARPLARWVGAGHAPTALAIVIDNSMSSALVQSGRPVLAGLKERAGELLSAAASGDRLWLVTADGRVRAGTAAALRDELAAVEPLSGAGDLAAAVSRAGAVVQSADLAGREVAIVTDGQRTTWRNVPRLDGVRVIVWTPAASPPPNRAVSAIELRPPRWSPRGVVAARVVTADSVSYRVHLSTPAGSERTLVRGNLAAGEEVVVRAAPPERGWLGLRVELEPDELTADDVRHAAVWVGPPPGVAVHAGAGPFARSAIDVLRADLRITDGRDVALLPADELALLPALIVAPADPVRLGAANRALERAGVPWRFGATRAAESTVRAGALAGTVVRQRYALLPVGAVVADTLAVSGGEPWIVAGPRYVLVGSPLDPAASDLPVRARFLPWLASMLTERLAGEGGGVVQAAPGARLARPAWTDALQLPGGERVALEDSVTAPARPGTAFFMRGNRVVGALVVNGEASESELSRDGAADIAARIGRSTATGTSLASDWPARAFTAAAGRSLVVPLLIAALMLLVVESVVVRGSRVREA